LTMQGLPLRMSGLITIRSRYLAAKDIVIIVVG
jgi:hypothetical protein